MSRRILALLLVLALCVGIFPMSVSAADAGTIEFTVGDASALPGEEFTVAVTVENELELTQFTQMTYDLTVEGLTLVSVVNGKDLTGVTADSTDLVNPADGAKWTMPDNGGELLLVTYKVNEDVEGGTAISLGMSVSYLFDRDTNGEYAASAKVNAGTLNVQEPLRYVTATVGSVSAKPGDTILVPVTLESDIKNVRGMGLNFRFDTSVLSYVDTKTWSKNITWSSFDGWGATSAYNLYKDSDGVKWPHFTNMRSFDSFGDAPNGLVATVQLKVAADAAPGTYEITLQNLNAKNGTYFTEAKHNTNIGTYNYTVIPGTLTIEEEETAETYAITVSNSANGVVTADKTKAAAGKPVTLTVTPNDGYILKSLKVNDVDISDDVVDGTYTFTMPDKAVRVRVTFMKAGPEPVFTVTADGVQYSMRYIGVQYYDDVGRDCEAYKVKLPAGTTEVTLATEGTHGIFILDMTNYTIAKDDKSCTMPVNGAVTIYKINVPDNNGISNYAYIRLEMPDHAVTVNTASHGLVKTDKEIAAMGETVTLTVKAASGFELDQLTVMDDKGNEVPVAADHTFVMPDAAVTVTATFKEKASVSHPVIVNKTEHGTVTADKTTAFVGETVKLTVTPDSGYILESLKILDSKGTTVYVAADHSFVMPDSPVDITAVFKGVSAETTPKVLFELSGYVCGKLANEINVAVIDANSTDMTGEWTCGLVLDPGDYAFQSEVLQPDTQYWLKATYTGSNPGALRNYTTADYALIGEENTGVQNNSEPSYNHYEICFKLPMLQDNGALFGFEFTGMSNAVCKTYVDGKEVTDASPGQTVTVVITPKDGYALQSLVVYDEWMTFIPVEQVGENAYTFVMPNSIAFLEAVIIGTDNVDSKATVTLGDVTDVLPGDKFVVPVYVANPPGGDYYIFDLYVEVPEGWTILGALDGPDSTLNSIDRWRVTPTMAGRYGMMAEFGSIGMGISFPEGHIMNLVVEASADAEPGVYKLDAISATLHKSDSESAAARFGQYVDGYVTVKSGPTEKIKLDPPAITDGMIRWYEDMVESRNLPACPQEANAVVEYRLAESKEELESAAWITGVVPPDDPRDNTTDDIVWITETMPDYIPNYGDLEADTHYYLQIRYNAYNDNYYIDSDPYEMEFTTKAWIEEPVVISTSDAYTSPGESFTVAVSLDHGFADKKFFEKELNLSFNSEYFTLTKTTMTNFGGSTLPEGEVALLTFTVNDGVEPGEYELDLTASEPIYLRYRRTEGFDDYYKHLRQYPVNYTFVSGTVTVRGSMSAPVLTDAVALEDTITVTAPQTLDGVKVEYSISADGRIWSDWQESNVFEGLSANTTYQLRARYVPEATSAYGPSEPSNVITATTNYEDILFAVADGAARTGKTVTVPVTVTHQLSGASTSIVLMPEYDTGKLVLDTAVLGEALTGDGWKLLAGDEIQIYKSGSEAFTVPEGEVAVLTFAVLDDAVAGDTAISLTADLYCGENLMNVEATYNAGTVHIHDETVVEGYAATCYADGLSNGLACSLCDEVFTEQYVLESKGHVLSDEVVAATHDCKGYTVTTCENCDYTTVGQFTDALDHDYVQSVTKEATCVEEGEWTFTCECGDSYTLAMPKTDHDCDAVVTAPTCTEGGYTTHTCKHCEFSYFTDLTEATGHKPVVIDAKEPTEDEEGYTGDTVCEVCEEVLAEGEVIPALKHDCPAEDFTDVDTSLWYHDAIDYVLDNGLMYGTGATTFAPNAVTTRGQLVTILYRAAGSPSVAGMSNPFSDVAAGTYYTDAVVWAANTGVTYGTSATTFAPNATITREQLVTILYRYTGSPAADGSALNGYADAGSVSSYAKNAMAWAVGNGVINGTSATTLSPKNNATRAQIAQILMNYMG